MSIRIGVCGIGRIATDDHIPMIKSVPGLELASLYDITPARRAYANREYRMHVHSDFSDFLNSGLDVVVISSPSNTHKDYALRAIQKGLHVIVEKPCGLNAKEASDIINAGKKKGVFVTSYHNRRWDTDFLTVRKIVEKGTIGNLVTLESRVVGYGNLLWYAVKEFDASWRYQKRYGGGVLLDFGTHLVDQLFQLITQKPVSVWCRMSSGVWSGEVEDYFKCLITFKGGMTAQLETGQISRYSLPRWYILGEKGAILCRDWFEGPVRVKVSSDKVREGRERTLQRAAPRRKDIFYKNIRDVLRGNASLIVTPEEIYRVMAVLDAARKSDLTGREIKFTV